MNRGAMRDKLRRRLQEDIADRWSDVQLNECLNLGLVETQKEIMKVDPEAFCFVDRADIVAGQEFYKWPAGTWYERELRILSGVTYTPMRRIAFTERADGAILSAPGPTYASFDRARFVLCPIPTVSVIDGLEIVWVPTLTMASDATVPPVHLGLHLAIVEFAEIIATADVGDTNEETIKDLARMINSIGQYYLVSASTPSRMIVEVSKGY